MKKLVFVVGTLLGIGLGLFCTIGQEISTKVVMCFFSTVVAIVVVGVIFGLIASIGGKITRRPYSRGSRSMEGIDLTNHGLSNCWLDQGATQSGSFEPEKGPLHQFDL